MQFSSHLNYNDTNSFYFVHVFGHYWLNESLIITQLISQELPIYTNFYTIKKRIFTPKMVTEIRIIYEKKNL